MEISFIRVWVFMALFTSSPALAGLYLDGAEQGGGGGGSGTDDQIASEVPFTPNGSIAATNTQLAIQEVRDEAGGGGSGDVVGPASSTSGTVVTFNGATGKLIQEGNMQALMEAVAAFDISQIPSPTMPANVALADYAEIITAGWDFQGAVTANIETLSFSSNTTLTTENVRGTYIVSTAAATFTLPAAAAGYSACILAGQGVTATIGITPAAGDYIVVDGARGTIATELSSGGAAGDKICFFAANSDDWYVTARVGTWAE